MTLRAGADVYIDSVAGDVLVDVGDGPDVVVTFIPFAEGGGSQEKAEADIRDHLELLVSEGPLLFIRVGRSGAESDTLGAHVQLTLPASFDGDFFVRASGSFSGALEGSSLASVDLHAGRVDASGVRSYLDIVSHGDVDVKVAQWGGGRMTTHQGDIFLSIPSNANGTLLLEFPDGPGEPDLSGLPAAWEREEGVEGVAVTLGDGVGATMRVSNYSGGTVTASAH